MPSGSIAPSSSWWEWENGSSLFFWRWHPDIREEVRDGLKVHILNPLNLPNFLVPQRLPSDGSTQVISTKVAIPVQKGYIEDGFVKSLSQFFAVPKVKEVLNNTEVVTDWRIVYDFTKSGLNDHIWAPNFPLPTHEAVLRQMSHKSYLGDLDEGEQFLNFPLDPKLRPYAGVDLTPVVRLDPAGFAPLWSAQHSASNTCARGIKCWKRWSVNPMGLSSSPYTTLRCSAWGEEIIRGNRRTPSNPLGWTHVRFNLPGDPSYTPLLSRVSLMKDDHLANDYVTFVDDSRTIGQDSASCRNVARQVGSRLTYLGRQDAARKRQFGSQTPGPWTGGGSGNHVANRNNYCSQYRRKMDKGKKNCSEMV